MLEYAMLPFDIMQERIRKRKKGKKKIHDKENSQKKKNTVSSIIVFLFQKA